MMKSIQVNNYKKKIGFMSSKINVEEIISKHIKSFEKDFILYKVQYPIRYKQIKEGIKEIIETVVDRCEKEAKTKTTCNFDGFESSNNFEIIDKDSISEVKKMINYE